MPHMKVLLYLLPTLLLIGCSKSSNSTKTEQSKHLQKAEFSADSAYQYIADQVALGSRTIGSEAHKQCVAYLSEQLERFGAEVELQEGEMKDYVGNKVSIVNIIGSYNKSAKERILLAAHYDSRPWADHDPDKSKWQTPILGANDGASGVGVLLEIARQLKREKSGKGIDIVFFDAEDMGAPEFYKGSTIEDDWCLGSQLWAKKCKENNQNSQYCYGIVLDMVGAGDAVFPQEYFSTRYASEYVRQLWQVAAQSGYGRYFSQEVSFPITDDHYYVNTIVQIPCVDIIHYVNSNEYGKSGFSHTWHTMADNLSAIDKATLDAVGTTVLTFVQQ